MFQSGINAQKSSQPLSGLDPIGLAQGFAIVWLADITLPDLPMNALIRNSGSAYRLSKNAPYGLKSRADIKKMIGIQVMITPPAGCSAIFWREG
jgi:hypothetical protein